MGTYIAHEDLLRGFEVPLDLTVHGVQDDNAVIGEDIEHISHTEAWEEQTQPWLCPSSSYRFPSPREVTCHIGGNMFSGQGEHIIILQLRCMGAGAQCKSWSRWGEVR